MAENATATLAWLPVFIGLALGGALLSAVLIVVLRPLLIRYALARPSARGLHTIPTPQGGGIAVLLACAAVALAGAVMRPLPSGDGQRLGLVLTAAAGLALVGLIDDMRPMPALPRLLLQLFAMAVGVFVLPEGTRVLPFLPLWLEQIVLVIGGAWFVNLTNFMDGMDGITVADLVPPTATLTIFSGLGWLPTVPGLLALGLLGGLLGFAPFNRPVARLFLGDVGSLPIGFLLAYGLFCLAGHSGVGFPGSLIAALLLTLYPVADSGATLLWRLRRGARIWTPHRDHFYQTAVARGRTISSILMRVGLANAACAALASFAVGADAEKSMAALVGGLAIVTALMAWMLADLEGGARRLSSSGRGHT